MKSSILLIPAIAALPLSAVSCDFRALYEEGQTPVDVIVMNDWTQLGADPEGATINFYPEDGSKPYTFKTNSVARAKVQVPSGYYSVQVFNRTEEEFGTMSFKGMERLMSGRAILDSKLFSWVGRADTIGRTVYEPEEIVAGRVDHFQVRSQSEREIYIREKGLDRDSGGALDSVKVKPLRVPYTGNVRITVRGLNNLSSARAYITGMAGEAYLATRSSGDTLATHVLEKWTVERDPLDYTKGYLNASFSCFGLPEQYLSESGKTEKNNKMVFQFKLVDGTTMIKEIRHVGNIADQNETERTVYFILQDPFTLPDVTPAGGQNSGFDVNFEDWDDPRDIPMNV